VPLRVGSGTRLKALEAMAAGRPVVGTSIGLGGLGLRPGEHALFADSAQGLASLAAQALVDDGLATRLAAAGRTLVEQRYDWRRIAAAYADELLARAVPLG